VWVLNLMNATKLEDFVSLKKIQGERLRSSKQENEEQVSKENSHSCSQALKRWTPQTLVSLNQNWFFFKSLVWFWSQSTQEPDPWFQFPKITIWNQGSQFHPGSTTRPPSWFRFLTGSWGQNQFQFGFNYPKSFPSTLVEFWVPKTRTAG